MTVSEKFKASYEKLRKMAADDQERADALKNIVMLSKKLFEVNMQMANQLKDDMSQIGPTAVQENFDFSIQYLSETAMDYLELATSIKEIDKDSSWELVSLSTQLLKTQLTILNAWPHQDSAKQALALEDIDQGRTTEVRDIIADLQN